MIIKSLSLVNFRNHLNLTLNFDSKIALIVGPNTSGKSNILEAAYFLASGRFNRARFDKDVINYDRNFAKISALIRKRSEEYPLECDIISTEGNRSRKIFKVNQIKRGLSSFLGNFSCVLFSPNSLELITNSPALRRDYMDFVLSQVDLGYRRSRIIYERVVKNRNRVLENIHIGNASRLQLEYWDVKLIESGTYLQDLRREFFNLVNGNIKEVGRKLGLAGDLAVDYLISSIDREKLESYRSKDIAATSTLIGPHKDDFEILLSGKSLKSFGSRGEQRTASLALKISELDFLEERLKERPVFLLDDIFSELDEAHRSAIREIIKQQQTIMTTADLALIPNSLKESAELIYL